MEEKLLSNKQVTQKTIFSFVVFFACIILSIVAWSWLRNSPKDNGVPKPIRSALNTNESIFTSIFFSNSHLSKIYPGNLAVPKVRVNGNIGMSKDFDPATWKLQLIRNAGDTQYITLDEIKALPKMEITFDFKCIEGWDQVTHWAGVRFSDFVAKYGLNDQAQLQYTGLHTPDNDYYVGIDSKSMMHPQTILCYEMNGKPLPLNQGAPLRLIIPVKYGVKHIKRIGTIFFSSTRPPDYWYERGYDYYCGL